MSEHPLVPQKIQRWLFVILEYSTMWYEQGFSRIKMHFVIAFESRWMMFCWRMSLILRQRDACGLTARPLPSVKTPEEPVVAALLINWE